MGQHIIGYIDIQYMSSDILQTAMSSFILKQKITMEDDGGIIRFWTKKTDEQWIQIVWRMLLAQRSDPPRI